MAGPALQSEVIGNTLANHEWTLPQPSTRRFSMKILIVDDHPLIREGLANVLRELDKDLAVIEAETAEEAVVALQREQDVSLLLLDLVLPGSDGLSLLHHVRTGWPEVPIVVLSANDNPQTVREAIDSGAMGFITKRSPTAVLVGALRLVLAGAVYIPPQALAADDTPVSPAHSTPTALGQKVSPSIADLGLTERQAEVLAHLVQGKPNKVICRELGLAEGTVKTHITAILRTLNVSSRTQAVFALSRLGVHLPFPFRSPTVPPAVD